MTLDVEKAKTTGLISLIALAVVALYWPTLGGDFLWDDDTHYTSNSVLREGGLLRSWLGQGQPNYWPLTWTSYWLEHRLFGLNPLVSHWINLLIHIANVALVGLIARRLGIPLAWGIALLFALHPANVESVAWITQRKNLLAMVFALGATAEFVFNLDKPSRASAISSALLFGASLLAKGAAVGLPAVFVAIAWWKRVPLDRSLAVRVAPHFALAVTFSLLEVFFMSRVRSGEEIFDLSLLERAELVARNLSFYLQTSVAPIDPTFVYPRWQLGRFDLLDMAPLLLWLVVSVGILVRKPAGWRGFAASQAIFLLMMAPVLGVFDIYFFKYSYVADHYLYLALPAITGLVVAALTRVSTRMAAAAVALTAALFAAGSFALMPMYAGNQALWTYTVAKNPDAWIAHSLLGVIDQDRGHYKRAEDRFKTALSLSPSAPDVGGLQLNLGNVLLLQGDPTAAIGHYEEAVRAKPGLTQAWCNLAVAHGQLGDFERHEEVLREALRSAHDKARVHRVFAESLKARGRAEEAKRHFDAAAQLDSNRRN